MPQEVILATWERPGPVALDAAHLRRQEGGGMLDALEAGLAACELDPTLVAIGLGSLVNQDGELELDASVMDGADLSCGAVCSVRGIVPVISVARKVKEETPHVMLAGEQARRFAIAKGFRPQNLMTDENVRQYNEWRADPTTHEARYVHSSDEHHGDTVTMLGWESPGHVVAACSTSGMAYKLPGRVGDSPIVGAGIYADDEAGAAGATGYGEELWKGMASFRAVEFMRSGMSPTEACEAVIRQIHRRQPNSHRMMCVVMAVSKQGEFGAACNFDTFHLWHEVDGVRGVTPIAGLFRRE